MKNAVNTPYGTRTICLVSRLHTGKLVVGFSSYISQVQKPLTFLLVLKIRPDASRQLVQLLESSAYFSEGWAVEACDKRLLRLLSFSTEINASKRLFDFFESTGPDVRGFPP
ncbi:unnamed protein product [Caenorhabditis auriculariae]|uniref:Uncharacterized protein n=1 Tax=Caenorhabditis auriculariae TaxID=2777116 RepID=A0A8S1GY40_9PELO|nr:unnamed protein product [Caenorhabditis auriculariae]